MGTTSPPPGEDPQKLELKDLMPQKPPPPSGPNWAHFGAAVGACLSLLGAAFASFSSGSSDRSATHAEQASHEITLTTEMLERARERAHAIEKHVEENDRRLTELEKWRAIQEAIEKSRK